MKLFLHLSLLLAVITWSSASPVSSFAAPVASRIIEAFKRDIVKELAFDAGRKYGTSFYLSKINSATYVNRSLIIEIKYNLNRSDYSLHPDLTCTVKLVGKAQLFNTLNLLANID